jgi:hypothetical protein
MAGVMCHSQTSIERGFANNLGNFQATYRLSLQLLPLNSSQSRHLSTDVRLPTVFGDARLPVTRKDTYIRASQFDTADK